MQPQPLDDLTVVDMTQSVAGPVCTQLLGEMGATVIKVEPPAGDNFRHLMGGSMFTPFNHGKQSLCVDLKSEDGHEIVTELVDEADVFVESFRPGVLEQYDLDYESVTERNEDVIYCSLSGFGRTGPYSSYPGYDPCIQAVSGLMATTGYSDRPPVRIRASLIDCGTGANAAFAILAAVRHRDRHGEGTEIDISLFDVAVAWMSYWVSRYDRTGDLPERAGGRGIGSAPNGVFPAGEDRTDYIYVATLSEAMYERLCHLLGRKDLLEDERFQTIEDRMDHRETLRDEFTAEFEQYDVWELESELLDAGVPSGAVRTVADLVDRDPHVEEREMLVESYNPETDEAVVAPALPFRFSAGIHDGGFSSRPPAKGEQTAEILEALSYSAADIDRLHEQDVVFSEA
ncbi:L-carnitine dehydratase/bile acid-inducible protein F [Natrialba hulunbeirensis JCM 10989]|uniref:L-carnitine dehydratase/bile acid-inducible protein F n=1 Tax=Natrialba hulunbeirensis JCM 10989 TaxID=1227493 RepID=M0A0H1_9EURY|nr:CoA transferase [Natrialba hulunbeirensis]ELY92084.1 L-carnitine dehydratase/bile acid-inducible protein F [Natrialba hulunbeirensis JCM 10989]